MIVNASTPQDVKFENVKSYSPRADGVVDMVGRSTVLKEETDSNRLDEWDRDSAKIDRKMECDRGVVGLLTLQKSGGELAEHIAQLTHFVNFAVYTTKELVVEVYIVSKALNVDAPVNYSLMKQFDISNSFDLGTQFELILLMSSIETWYRESLFGMVLRKYDPFVLINHGNFLISRLLAQHNLTKFASLTTSWKPNSSSASKTKKSGGLEGDDGGAKGQGGEGYEEPGRRW